MSKWNYKRGDNVVNTLTGETVTLDTHWKSDRGFYASSRDGRALSLRLDEIEPISDKPEFKRGERVLAWDNKDKEDKDDDSIYLFTDAKGLHHCAVASDDPLDSETYGVEVWDNIAKLPAKKPVITIDGREVDPADYNAAEWAAIREGIVG